MFLSQSSAHPWDLACLQSAFAVQLNMLARLLCSRDRGRGLLRNANVTGFDVVACLCNLVADFSLLSNGDFQFGTPALCYTCYNCYTGPRFSPSGSNCSRCSRHLRPRAANGNDVIGFLP